MPNGNTFQIPTDKKTHRREKTDGIWIDPYANTSKLATITNDLNPEYDTDYHLDALDFLKQFEDDSIDGVFFDPPYSPRQVAECYHGVGRKTTITDTQASFWAKQKVGISRIVKNKGKVISFGWNSNGIGKKYGFRMDRILLVAHGSNHNDTICVVETKHVPKRWFR